MKIQKSRQLYAWIAVGVGAVASAVVAMREFPALRRYIRMKRM
jgi:hypothetical protein